MSDDTIKNLNEVKDSAPDFQMDGALEARFAREDVGGTEGEESPMDKPDWPDAA